MFLSQPGPALSSGAEKHVFLRDHLEFSTGKPLNLLATLFCAVGEAYKTSFHSMFPPLAYQLPPQSKQRLFWGRRWREDLHCRGLYWYILPLPSGAWNCVENIPTQNRRWSSFLTWTQGASQLFRSIAFLYPPKCTGSQKPELPPLPMSMRDLCWEASSLGTQSPSRLRSCYWKWWRSSESPGAVRFKEAQSLFPQKTAQAAGNFMPNLCKWSFQTL